MVSVDVKHHVYLLIESTDSEGTLFFSTEVDASHVHAVSACFGARLLLQSY